MENLEDKANDLIENAKNGISSIISDGISSKNNSISNIKEEPFRDSENNKFLEREDEIK